MSGFFSSNPWIILWEINGNVENHQEVKKNLQLMRIQMKLDILIQMIHGQGLIAVLLLSWLDERWAWIMKYVKFLPTDVWDVSEGPTQQKCQSPDII